MPLFSILTSTPAWDEITVNRILIVVLVFTGLVGLKEVFKLIPALLDVFGRTKASIWFEYNNSFVRRRNIVSMLCIVPVCLLVDRFELYHPPFWSLIPAEWRVLATVTVFIFYLTVRHVFGLFMNLFYQDHLAMSAVRNGLKNYFILLCFAALISTGILTALNFDDATVRIVLYFEIALAYLAFLIRSAEILKASSSTFATILYLCGPEILPAAALVSSAVFL